MHACLCEPRTGVVHHVNLGGAQQLLADGHGAQRVHSTPACRREERQLSLLQAHPTNAAAAAAVCRKKWCRPRQQGMAAAAMPGSAGASWPPCELTGIAHGVDVAYVPGAGERRRVRATGVSVALQRELQAQSSLV